MGYRSVGKLYLKEDVYNLLPDNLKQELEEDWDEETTSFSNDGHMVYSFEEWKWYESYKEVQEWNNFFNSLEENELVEDTDWDFIVIGEDNAIVDHRTWQHFSISMNIEVF